MKYSPIIQTMSKRNKVRVRKALRGTKALITELGTGAAYALKH